MAVSHDHIEQRSSHTHIDISRALACSPINSMLVTQCVHEIQGRKMSKFLRQTLIRPRRSRANGAIRLRLIACTSRTLIYSMQLQAMDPSKLVPPSNINVAKLVWKISTGFPNQFGTLRPPS
jgi:hypothetical protein